MSRPIPYSAEELHTARCRPAEFRTPIPREGDTVLCRLNEWGPAYAAEVERVQPLDDVDDPHLAEVTLDERQEVVVLEGRPVMAMVDDPWPTLWLVVDTPRGKIRTHTREARLRGSAGWLPLDWESRRRPLPAAMRPLLDDAQEG